MLGLERESEVHGSQPTPCPLVWAAVGLIVASAGVQTESSRTWRNPGGGVGEVGAHAAFPSDPSSIEAVRDLTGGRGAEAVFDFVGIQATTDLAAKLVGIMSDIVMVGLGEGAVRVGIGTLPDETSVRAPIWGTRSELFEVLDLARSGAITVETERFSLEDGPKAFERLHARTLRGQAVLVP